MKKNILLFCILLGIIYSNIFGQSIEDLEYITEFYPPYNYEENGELKGMAVELLEIMLEVVGSDISREDFKIYPWSRGFKMSQMYDNICLFSMTRTKEREKNFKWVGPIKDATFVLIGNKKDKIEIKDIKHLNKYKIGVVKDDIGELILKEAGLSEKNMSKSLDSKHFPKILQSGRIDMWIFGEKAAFNIIRNNNMNTEDFEVFYKFGGETGNYFGFSKGVSDNIIKKLQLALDHLKNDGTYEQLVNKYFE